MTSNPTDPAEPEDTPDQESFDEMYRRLDLERTGTVAMPEQPALRVDHLPARSPDDFVEVDPVLLMKSFRVLTDFRKLSDLP